jgi:hypothetical protein
MKFGTTYYESIYIGFQKVDYSHSVRKDSVPDACAVGGQCGTGDLRLNTGYTGL